MKDFREFEAIAGSDQRSRWVRDASEELIQETGETTGTRTQSYPDHQPVWLTW